MLIFRSFKRWKHKILCDKWHPIHPSNLSVCHCHVKETSTLLAHASTIADLPRPWRTIASMGTKSLKRRARESQNPPMAAADPPRRKPLSYAKASVVLSAFLVVSVIAPLVLSSNKFRAFQRRVSYETITVVNVFPHDPEAFTQVNLFFLRCLS